MHPWYTFENSNWFSEKLTSNLDPEFKITEIQTCFSFLVAKRNVKKKKNPGDYILHLSHSQDFSENFTSSSDLDVKVTGTQNGLRFLVDGVEFQSPVSHWSRVIQFKNSGVHAVRPPGRMTTIPHQPFMADEVKSKEHTTTKHKSVFPFNKLWYIIKLWCMQTITWQVSTAIPHLFLFTASPSWHSHDNSCGIIQIHLLLCVVLFLQYEAFWAAWFHKNCNITPLN